MPAPNCRKNQDYAQNQSHLLYLSLQTLLFPHSYQDGHHFTIEKEQEKTLDRASHKDPMLLEYVG